jgi:hypothetical protein
MSDNVDYRMKLRVQGATISGKIWQRICARARYWNATATDTTFTSGDVGMIPVRLGKPVSQSDVTPLYITWRWTELGRYMRDIWIQK